MFSCVFDQLPFWLTVQRLACVLGLSFILPLSVAADTGTEILTYDRAILSSLGGERPVVLPHALEPGDFPAEGGRVRYKVEVDLKSIPREPLGIFLPKISLSGRLFLNGAYTNTCGIGELENLRCLHQPQLFVPPVSLWRPGLNTLEFEIYANDRQVDGISRLQIGPAQALNEGSYLKHWFWRVELLRGLTWVAVTLGFLALAIGQIIRAEKLHLWFGLTCITNALSNLNILIVMPGVPIEWFNWFIFSSRFVSTSLMILMLLAFFDRASTLIVRTLLAYSILMPIAIWLTDTNRWVVASLYLPLAVAGILLLINMTRWTWRSRRKIHIAVNLIYFVLFVAGVWDWLLLAGETSFETFYKVTYVLTGILVIFGTMLISRLAIAFISERRLSELLGLASRAANAGIWDWSLADNDLKWSREMKTLFGVDPDACGDDFDARSTWRSRLHPEDLPVAERETARAVRDQLPLAQDYRIVLPDGNTRWIEMRADIIRDTPDKSTHLIGICLDVTQRRAADERLRDSEARFRQLFLHLPIAYQSLDIAGNWLDTNEKMAEMLGFDNPESMRGLCFGDYWDEAYADQFPVTFGDLKSSGSVHGDLHLHRRDGSTFLAQIIGYVQRDNQGRFQRTHCVLIDVTERRLLEDKIRAINASLEQKVEERTAQLVAANAAKSMFLANMSHEIRTPMNAVIGLAQILEREPLSDEVMEMIKRISAAGRSLLSIINDILDLSKIEAGQLELEREAFELSEVLKHIRDLLAETAHQKDLTLRIETQPLGGRLIGDSLRLEQILMNLTGNAIKFTEEGGVIVHVKVMNLSETTAQLRFEVKDTGIGMAPDIASRLFQPFTQADAGTTRRFGGTGLGLSISKRLVELMGGVIGVDSVPEQGSTFWFEIPFAFSRQEEVVTASVQPKQQGPRLVGVCCLVVDDNQVNLFLAERVLKKEGAEVFQSKDGKQALDRLLADPAAYDIVLMDIQMPVMDGLAAVRMIRSERRIAHLPVIALSAGVMARERQDALDAGFDDFMPKPFNIDQIVEMVRTYCPPRGF